MGIYLLLIKIYKNLDKLAFLQIESDLKLINKFNEYSTQHEQNISITNINKQLFAVAKNMNTYHALNFYADMYFRDYLKNKNLSDTLLKIELKEKSTGVQMGNILKIYYKTNDSIDHSQIFHVKTHSNGIQSFNYSKDGMDYREMLIYKFFQLISLGPEVHFFYNYSDPKDFFIATKSLGDDFLTMPEIIFNYNENKKCFKLNDQNENDNYYDYNCDLNFKQKLNQYSDDFKKNSSNINEFIFLDLITKLLNADDLTTNGANYGFIEKHLKIIDFGLQKDKKDQNYFVYDDFIDSKSNMNKTSFIRLYQIMNEDIELKKQHAKFLVSNELKEFKRIIQEAFDFTFEFINANKDRLFNNIQMKDDQIDSLNNYVKNIIQNFDDFVLRINN